MLDGQTKWKSERESERECVKEREKTVKMSQKDEENSFMNEANKAKSLE